MFISTGREIFFTVLDTHREQMFLSRSIDGQLASKAFKKKFNLFVKMPFAQMEI